MSSEAVHSDLDDVTLGVAKRVKNATDLCPAKEDESLLSESDSEQRDTSHEELLRTHISSSQLATPTVAHSPGTEQADGVASHEAAACSSKSNSLENDHHPATAELPQSTATPRRSQSPHLISTTKNENSKLYSEPAKRVDGRARKIPPLAARRPYSVPVNLSLCASLPAMRPNRPDYEEIGQSSAGETSSSTLPKVKAGESPTRGKVMYISKSLPGSVPTNAVAYHSDVQNAEDEYKMTKCVSRADPFEAVISQEDLQHYGVDSIRCSSIDLDSFGHIPNRYRLSIDSFESYDSNHHGNSFGSGSVGTSLDLFYDIPLDDEYEEMYCHRDQSIYSEGEFWKCHSLYERLVRKVMNYGSTSDTLHSNQRGSHRAGPTRQRSHHSDQGPYASLCKSETRDQRRTRSTTPTRGSKDLGFPAFLSDHKDRFAGMLSSSKKLLGSLSGSSLFGFKTNRKITFSDEKANLSVGSVPSTVSSAQDKSQNADESRGTPSLPASTPWNSGAKILDRRMCTHTRRRDCSHTVCASVVIAVMGTALMSSLVAVGLLYVFPPTGDSKTEPEVWVAFESDYVSVQDPSVDVSLDVNMGEELAIKCSVVITLKKKGEEEEPKNTSSLYANAIFLEQKRRSDSQYSVVASLGPGPRSVLTWPWITAAELNLTKDRLKPLLDVTMLRASCLEEGDYRCRVSVRGNASEPASQVFSGTKTVHVKGCQQEKEILDDVVLNFRMFSQLIRADVDKVELHCSIPARLMSHLTNVSYIRIFKQGRSKFILASVNKGEPVKTTNLTSYTQRGITAKGAANLKEESLHLTVAWNSSFPEDLGMYGCEAETEISTMRRTIKSGEGLTIESTCPGSEWTLVGSTCYRYPQFRLTGQQASENCSRNDSHLVEINDEQEMGMLEKFLGRKKAASVWIGLQEADIPGELKWNSTNTIVSVNNTLLKNLTRGPAKTGRPRCFALSAAEHYRVVEKACDVTLHFLCEQDPLMKVKETKETGENTPQQQRPLETSGDKGGELKGSDPQQQHHPRNASPLSSMDGVEKAFSARTSS